MLKVPMYQPRIPIGRGGISSIDVRPRVNPVADALARRETEADIAYRQKQTGLLGREEQHPMRIVSGGGKTYLVDTVTGEKKDLGIEIPEELSALINAFYKMQRVPVEGAGGEEGRVSGALLDMIKGRVGVKDYGTQSRAGALGDSDATNYPALQTSDIQEELFAPPRRKVPSKTRPPKPKEYPDAKWSEEHQMWTIIKNSRLMGVK